jgi:hypothetical protein
LQYDINILKHATNQWNHDRLFKKMKIVRQFKLFTACL